jgi:hypothetical protein
VDEDRFEEHGNEAHFGTRVGEDAPEVRDHRRTVDWRGRRGDHAAEGEERRHRHDRAERAENREHAAPTQEVADHARDRGANEVAREPYRQQPADRHLALIDRYEIADQRHCDRKHSARHQSGRDPHGNEQRKARGHRADQRRNRNHEQA